MVASVLSGNRNLEGRIHSLVETRHPSGVVHRFEVDVLLQTPKEVAYYLSGGLLPYVVRKLSVA